MKPFGYILVAVSIWIGCSPKTATTTGTAGRKYSEDISIWRPKLAVTDTSKTDPANATVTDPKKTVYVEPKFHINEALDNVLDSISRVNLAMGYVDGYTIQIYSGLKREEALNVKKQISSSLPQLEAEVQYVQPNFRVRAGKYFDRFSAIKDYQAIKRHFPNAILLPERIPIQ
jgi:hypothetical protein